MPDYSKGKIYNIESLSNGLLYIGSTCQPLAVRLGGHIRDFKQYKNETKNFISSFNVLEYDDYEILLIEDYPCDRREQLIAREGEWIRKMDCVNKIIPGRTKKQWRQDNADKLKQWRQDNADKLKQYYQDNADKLKKQQKLYYQDNADKIKEQHKQFYQDNADKLKEQNKQYKQANADKIKANNNCECGGKFTTQHKSTHLNSKKHQKYLSLS